MNFSTVVDSVIVGVPKGRDRGAGSARGHMPPPHYPPICLELKRVSKKRCLVPPPNIESLMVPLPPISKLFRSPLLGASFGLLIIVQFEQ